MSTLSITRPAPAPDAQVVPASVPSTVPATVTAWRAEVARRLGAELGEGADREAQMDARRRAAGLERADAAVQASLEEGRRPAPGSSPRVVVVHRSDWLRDRLVQHLQDRGAAVVGQGDDGAAALAATLVDQPDVLVIEGLLPWVTPVDVVQDVRRFAPRTFVVVLVEGPAAAEHMLAAGAHAVYSRAVPPADVADAVVRALGEAAGSSASRVSA